MTWEFSKRMLLLAVGMNVILACIGLAYMWVNEDSTVYSYLAGIWGAEMTTATAFYFNKAKAENVKKIEIGEREEYNDSREI